MKAIYYQNWESSFIPHILKEIYLDKVFASYFVGKSNLTILDIGANIGLTAQYFSQFGHIYAVEPCKESFDCLVQMIEYNKLDITTINCAISTKNEKIFLYHTPNSTSNTLIPVRNSIGKEEVESKTLTQLLMDLKLDKVDFVKMDIEGSEFEVLGSNTFNEVAPKINAILGEIHTWAGRNPGQVYQALQNRGFKVKKVLTDANLFFAEK